MIAISSLLLYGFLTGLLVGLLSPVYDWYLNSRPLSPQEKETMRLTQEGFNELHRANQKGQ